MTKNNAHAHMGIGAVDDAGLRKLLSEKVPEDQPPEAHALVALAKRCLRAFPKDRPVRFKRRSCLYHHFICVVTC